MNTGLLQSLAGLLPILVIAALAWRAGWHLTEMQEYRKGGEPSLKDRRLADWYEPGLYSEMGQQHQRRGLQLLRLATAAAVAYVLLLMALNLMVNG